MPINRQWPGETREMRLVGKVIALTKGIGDKSLPEFIARRRSPGGGWRTWDELSYELTQIIGEIITDGTLRHWAKRYGIPEGTKADGDGEAYVQALTEASISIS
jgi:hypothetical protein